MRIINWIKKLLGFGTVVNVPQPVPQDVGIPSNPIGEVPTPCILIGEIRANSEAEKQMVIGGFINARIVLYSKEFKEEVLKFKFNPNLTNGLSNQEIYNRYVAMTAAVAIEMFTGNWWQNHRSKTNAFERNAEGFIRVNRYFINTSYLVGSVILHELGHGLGFTHPRLEQNSVPYGMNKIYEIVCERIGIKQL